MDEHARLICVVDDALTPGATILSDLQSLKGQGFSAIPVPFSTATELPRAGGIRERLGAALRSPNLDTVVLDLIWRSRKQEGEDEWDCLGLVTEGMRVLQLLLSRTDRPRRIVCYSHALHSAPLLNIAFREPVATQLGCSVLDLPATGPIRVGDTEVLYYDDVTVLQDSYVSEIVLADAPRHTLSGPTAQDFADLDLPETARPLAALLEVEAHHGPWRSAPKTFVQGEVLATWVRPSRHNEQGTIDANARYAIRSAGEQHLDRPGDEPRWRRHRDLLRRTAGFDQLL